MAKELRTEIEIDAPPERVWRVLTDFASFPEWNPFMPNLHGEAKVGSKLEVEMRPPGGRAMTFRPTVLAATPNRELRWLGRVGLPGVFDGEHRFAIEALDGNRSRFVQSERFTGALVLPIMLMIEKSTLRGFEEMNAALKGRAEAGG
ncbi:MAG: SRPBCC domain-containing protein [Dehalococcoidia bacterium]